MASALKPIHRIGPKGPLDTASTTPRSEVPPEREDRESVTDLFEFIAASPRFLGQASVKVDRLYSDVPQVARARIGCEMQMTHSELFAAAVEVIETLIELAQHDPEDPQAFAAMSHLLGA